jgi:hypothetical protein
MRARFVIAALLVGCGGTSTPPAEPARTQPHAESPPAQPDNNAPCDVMADRIMKFGRADESARPIYIRHCIDDKYSLETRRCFLTMNAWEDAQSCMSTMTKAQLDAITADAEARGYHVVKKKQPDPPPIHN